MNTPVRRTPPQSVTPNVEVDENGKPIGNLILRGLPPTEAGKISPALEFVRLKLHQVLHESGETIKSVYFLNQGLGSVLTVQPNGKSVEVGLIGKEGYVGLPVIFGFLSSALRVVVQTDGSAYRIDAEKLCQLLQSCPTLQTHLQRFSMMMAMQSTQIAACNRLHNVEERLARWLLMSHDRVGEDTMPLTQEFLSQMLGTRRASVSVAAGALQKKKMIEYTRGSVRIVDRKELEETACVCYEVIQNQRSKWNVEAQTTDGKKANS